MPAQSQPPAFVHAPSRDEKRAHWANGLYLGFAASVIFMLTAASGDGALASLSIIVWVWMVPVFLVDQILLMRYTPFATSAIVYGLRPGR